MTLLSLLRSLIPRRLAWERSCPTVSRRTDDRRRGIFSWPIGTQKTTSAGPVYARSGKSSATDLAAVAMARATRSAASASMSHRTVSLSDVTVPTGDRCLHIEGGGIYAGRRLIAIQCLCQNLSLGIVHLVPVNVHQIGGVHLHERVEQLIITHTGHGDTGAVAQTGQRELCSP